MKVIAHRGNIDGINLKEENSPNYIEGVISRDFDVEIDLWFIDGGLFLGHDEAVHSINYDFLERYQSKLWIHCKNFEAYRFLKDKDNANLNYFMHDRDPFTITSQGYYWSFPQFAQFDNSIAVCPEKFGFTFNDNIYAICTDNIELIKKYL